MRFGVARPLDMDSLSMPIVRSERCMSRKAPKIYRRLAQLMRGSVVAQFEFRLSTLCGSSVRSRARALTGVDPFHSDRAG
jgi:hypothetical protein